MVVIQHSTYATKPGEGKKKEREQERKKVIRGEGEILLTGG